ncbi:MAG: hypothetical protein ED557_12625 [Balneola sp.]|nr:MAG: hypothetical protein ED557_12625 [Balneola sp.]
MRNRLFFLTTISIVCYACNVTETSTENCFDQSFKSIIIAFESGLNSSVRVYNNDLSEIEFQDADLYSSPFHIFRSNDFYYYTYSDSDSTSLFVKRLVSNNERIGSVSLNKGSSLQRIDSINEIYTTFFYSPQELIVTNDTIINREVDFVTHAIYEDQDRYFGVNREAGEFRLVEFQDHDTLQIAGISNLINRHVNAPSYILSMVYQSQDERLIITVEDISNAPDTYLIDIDLKSGESKSFKVGDHSRLIIEEMSNIILLTHQLTYRLNSEPVEYVHYYDTANKTIKVFTNLGVSERVTGYYVQDIVVTNCSAFVATIEVENDGFTLKVRQYDFQGIMKREVEIKQIYPGQEYMRSILILN